jgi:hypothetical protein
VRRTGEGWRIERRTVEGTRHLPISPLTISRIMSGKQKRLRIVARRKAKSEKRERASRKDPRLIGAPPGAEIAPCNPSLLAPYNSYGCPKFVERGYYVDSPFKCVDCGIDEIWRATQQKWWYEVAKGQVWTQAKRCRNCRRKERERSAESRRVHLEGVAAKKKKRAA